jgi:hypothetical protein
VTVESGRWSEAVTMCVEAVTMCVDVDVCACLCACQVPGEPSREMLGLFLQLSRACFNGGAVA